MIKYHAWLTHQWNGNVDIEQGLGVNLSRLSSEESHQDTSSPLNMSHCESVSALTTMRGRAKRYQRRAVGLVRFVCMWTLAHVGSAALLSQRGTTLTATPLTTPFGISLSSADAAIWNWTDV